jgi:hypothetical protein
LYAHELFPHGNHYAVLQSIAALSSHPTQSTPDIVGMFRDRLGAEYDGHSRDLLLAAMRFGAAYEAFAIYFRRQQSHDAADRIFAKQLAHELADAVALARDTLLPAYADRVARLASQWQALLSAY